MARVGILTSSSPEGPRGEVAFLKALPREIGWVEGKNVEFFPRFAEGVTARLDILAADLVRRGMDVIVTVSTDETRAAKAATASIPIVMVVAGDPVLAGFIQSLARPGGNITGTTVSVGPETWGKRLEILTTVASSADRVALLWNPAAIPGPEVPRRAAEESARRLGLRLASVEIRSQSDLPATFAAMERDGITGILFVNSSDLYPRRRQIADLAISHRLPMIGMFPQDADAGALLSYGTNFRDLYRRAAVYIDRILRGTRPADLAVERPTKFDLVLNLKTAKALGITMPPALRLRADRIID
ncbi:MAG: ABC transporter substrate-binding protein [Candidatus Rokubacteria bacterium]|nr:ABC transporter substrate-binding protein [Candidatus Rokubacteria bacterium]